MRINTVLLRAAVVFYFTCSCVSYAQKVKITSFKTGGDIAWSCSSLNVTCRVEGAQSPCGPWQTLQSTWMEFPTNTLTSINCRTSRFFRVVYDIPDPHITDITTQQALSMFCGCSDDPGFVVLDVRRASEYATLHIVGALNIDRYSSTFVQQLNALDKTKMYLVHCAAGSRSAYARDKMRTLGFKEVYNMLGGINAFKLLPGAESYLEP